MDFKKILRALPKKAKTKTRETKLFFKRIEKKTPKNFSATVMKLNDEVFAYTDCMQCANCCKKGTPVFKPVDIKRLSSHLKLSAKDFEKKYLKTDEVNEKILQKSPCVFLGKDNLCTVYEHRPGDCRKYPHTGYKNFQDRVEMAQENMEMCPAVFDIVEKLKIAFPKN